MGCFFASTFLAQWPTIADEYPGIARGMQKCEQENFLAIVHILCYTFLLQYRAAR